MAINTISRIARRKKRVSTNIHGTTERPRVSIYRSSRYIYAQVINDDKHSTIASVHSMKEKGTKSESAKQVGINLGAKLKELKITAVVFDRSAYSYNGRVKSLAEGLREAGIQV